MSLGRTGRTNHAKGGRPPKRRTVVIHGGRALWNHLFSYQLIMKLKEMLTIEQGGASGRCWGSCHSGCLDVETENPIFASA